MSAFGGLLPGYLTGQSPVEQNILQGFQNDGTFGGLLHAISQAPNALGEAAGTSFMTSPLGGLGYLGGALTTGRDWASGRRIPLGQRLLAAGGVAAGAATGFGIYRALRDSGGLKEHLGELPMDESGTVNFRKLLPGADQKIIEPSPQPLVSEAPGEEPYPIPKATATPVRRITATAGLFKSPQSEVALKAGLDFEGGFNTLARSVGSYPAIAGGETQLRDAVLGGHLRSLGEELSSSNPDYAPHPADTNPEHHFQQVAAYAVGKLNTAAAKGIFDNPDMKDLAALHEKLLSTPEKLTPEEGQQWHTFAKAFDDVTKHMDADLHPQPQARWITMTGTPESGLRPMYAFQAEGLGHQLIDRATMIPKTGPGGLEDAVYRMIGSNPDVFWPYFVLNNLDVYHLAGDIDHRYGLPWYAESRHLITHTMRERLARGLPEPTPEMSGPAVFSAHSPRTDFDRNVNAMQAHLLGQPLPPGVMARNRELAQAILDSDQKSSLDLFNGLKTSNFLVNAEHPNWFGPTTVDVHDFNAQLGFIGRFVKPLAHESTPEGRRIYQMMSMSHNIATWLLDKHVPEYSFANPDQSQPLSGQFGSGTEIPGSSAPMVPNQLQAVNWSVVRNMANDVKGRSTIISDRVLRELEGRSNMGFQNPDIVRAAQSADAVGLGLPITVSDPFPQRRNKTTPSVGFVTSVGEQGDAAVWGNLRPDTAVALRGLVPIDDQPGDGLILFQPLRPRILPVSVSEAVKGILPGSDQIRPETHSVQIHSAVGFDAHPTRLPGHHFTVTGPTGVLPILKTHLGQLGEGITTEDLQTHERFAPKIPQQRLGLDDLDKQMLADPDRSPLKTHQWAAISAHTTQHNPELHEQLRQDLTARGYQPIEVKGVYGGAPEKSFLVFGMGNREAMALGKKYEQESVLTPTGYLYTTGENAGKYHPVEGMTLGRAPKDASTTIRFPAGHLGGGKPVDFRFASDINFDKLEKIPANVDQPLAEHVSQPREGVVIHLPDDVLPEESLRVYQQLEAFRRRFEPSLETSMYTHGTAWTPGFQSVAEHVLADGAGNLGLVRDGSAPGPSNRSSVMLPPRDALPLSSRQQQPTTGELHWINRGTHAIVDNELRVFTPGAQEFSGTRLSTLKINGEKPKLFSLDLQPTVAPVLSFIDDPTQATGSIVGHISDRRIILELPAEFAQTAPQVWQAQELLRRSGLVGGRKFVLQVQGQPVKLAHWNTTAIA